MQRRPSGHGSCRSVARSDSHALTPLSYYPLVNPFSYCPPPPFVILNKGHLAMAAVAALPAVTAMHEVAATLLSSFVL